MLVERYKHPGSLATWGLATWGLATWGLVVWGLVVWGLVVWIGQMTDWDGRLVPHGFCKESRNARYGAAATNAMSTTGRTGIRCITVSSLERR